MVAGEGGDTGLHISIHPKTHWKTQSLWDGQYVGVYGSDINLDIEQTVLAIEGARLKANLPH